MWKWLVASVMGFVVGCAAGPNTPLLIDDPANLMENVGRTVVLRGALSAGKSTSVIGVSVHGEGSAMDGLVVEAEGTLRLLHIPVPVDPFESVAQRVGTFFVLEDPGSPNHLARVRRVTR